MPHQPDAQLRAAGTAIAQCQDGRDGAELELQIGLPQFFWEVDRCTAPLCHNLFGYLPVFHQENERLGDEVALFV